MTLRVFYLDDEAGLCQIFNEYYSSESINVDTFTDPNEAIEACKSNPPDVFFIDYRLPGYTGDEIANSVSENIEKILVTGDLSVPHMDQFQQIVKKPFSLKAIREILSGYL